MEIVEIHRLLKAIQRFENESRDLAFEYHNRERRLTGIGDISAISGLSPSFIGNQINAQSNISFTSESGGINYSLTWATEIRLTTSSAFVFGNVTGLYSDEPYQTLIEMFGPYPCQSTGEILEALDFVGASVLSNLALHLRQNDLQEVLTAGQKAPFFSNL